MAAIQPVGGAGAAPEHIGIRIGDNVQAKFKVISEYDEDDEDDVIRLFNSEVIEAGPCRLEVTESKLVEFYNYLEHIKNHNPEVKQTLHYLFPTLFPSEEPISLPEGNVFRSKSELLELLRSLNADMDITARREKLLEIYNYVNPGTLDKEIEENKQVLRLIRLVSKARHLIKPSQVINVRITDDLSAYSSGKYYSSAYNNSGNAVPIPLGDVYAYYVAHNCSPDDIHFIAEGYDIDSIDGVFPVQHNTEDENIIKSTLPNKYTLEQITEINSWITHGLLSIYLIRPDIVHSVCTNPFVGNAKFWAHVQAMMEHQFTILHSLTVPISNTLVVYRGSTFFPSHDVRRRSIFATSLNETVANNFAGKNDIAKLVIIPPGTRILDLSHINQTEKEILIFPYERDANMVIEPLEIINRSNRSNSSNRSKNKNKRNTYRIRNITNRNRNLPRSRRQSRRRRK